MIDKKVVLTIHTKLIKMFGGSFGIRDESLIESALLRFDTIKFYNKNSSIFDCIAAVVFALINNHPFIDGNKRVGVVICELLLSKNGYELKATGKEKYLIYIGIASGSLTENDFSKWIKDKVLD
jgi:death-on-curing protein